ncbi:MAG: hypothetical protein LBV63_03860 [Candidatus Methanoplasma sp.]|nr:hypothetical protein [Candidatus Methanoplasma sp.]
MNLLFVNNVGCCFVVFNTLIKKTKNYGQFTATRSVYTLGGFLRDEKTTLLMKLASMYAKRGQGVAIPINESREIGVDGATIKADGYDPIELTDGCLCCSLSGTLQSALKNIKKDIDPDIILIGPTGLALPHLVRDLVQHSITDPDEMIILGGSQILRGSMNS